jgi:hypothetical protein
MHCLRFLRAIGRIALCAPALCCWAQTPSQAPLDWCDVTENASDLDGKIIEVRATYRTSFETSELHCLGCRVNGSAWVDFHNASPFPAPLHGMRSGTANVIFAGKFRSSGGPFGHLGQYKFLFDVTAVKKAEKIEPNGLPPDVLPPELAAKVCGGRSASADDKAAVRK